jgi:hypothetical protein
MPPDGQDDPPRNPLLDPRLAGAGGMLLAAAALAFLLTHGAHRTPAPAPTTSVTASR